jgi:hypothetical protein
MTTTSTATLQIAVKLALNEAQKQFQKFTIGLGNTVEKSLHRAFNPNKFKKDIDALQTSVNEKLNFKATVSGDVNKLIKKKDKNTEQNPVVVRTKLQSQVLSLGRTYNSLKDAGLDTSDVLDTMKLKMNQLAIATKGTTLSQKELEKQTGKVIKETKKMNFDFLTLLFVGMAIQRTFGGIFKSIVNSYRNITGLNSQFGKSTQKLSASFNYLKFAIGNALNNPVIISAIEKLSDWLERLGDWFAQHPNFAITLVAIAQALALYGGILIGASFLIQLKTLFTIFSSGEKTKYSKIWTGLKKIGIYIGKLSKIGWTKLSSGVSAFVTALSSLSLATLGVWVLAAAIVSAAIYAIYKLNSKHLDDLGLEVTGTWNNIKSVTVTFLAGLGNLFVLAITGIASLFIGLSSITDIAVAAMKESFNQLWNSIKAGWNALWSKENISDAVVESFNTEEITKKIVEAFEKSEETLKKAGDISVGFTDAINNWEVDKQIEWAGAVKKGSENMDELNILVEDALIELDKQKSLIDGVSESYTEQNTQATTLQTTLASLSQEQVAGLSVEYEKLKTILFDVSTQIYTMVLFMTDPKEGLIPVTHSASVAVIALTSDLTALMKKLTELNGKTFTYTIKEKRVSEGSSGVKSLINTVSSVFSPTKR